MCSQIFAARSESKVSTWRAAPYPTVGVRCNGFLERWRLIGVDSGCWNRQIHFATWQPMSGRCPAIEAAGARGAVSGPTLV